MNFLPRPRGLRGGAPISVGRSYAPNRYDLTAIVILLAIAIALGHAARAMGQSLVLLDIMPVSLSPWMLPEYAARSTLRMLAAICASLLFTFTVATLAAKSRRAGQVIIPALDILQSVPVLGFITFTVVFFMGLFPGSQLGAELAAIFAIFTSQAWNMAFSFYQSLKTLPNELDEVSRHFRLSGWMRFWRVEAPFAAPGLIWNTMMSMSGGWFFVVASEAISVGKTDIRLPGIGSYLSLAIEQRDLAAVGWAILAMAFVILTYDQLVFRPIVAWADKFRAEQTAGTDQPRSWFLDVMRRTRLLKALARGWRAFVGDVAVASRKSHAASPRQASPWLDRAWQTIAGITLLVSIWVVGGFVRRELGLADIGAVALAGCATFLRVIVLVALASVVWVPIGIWVGLRPRVADRIQPLAQFMAAFPANVLFPVFVIAIARWGLDPNIWLSPLMILGAQWYILFNVIAGASAFPNDLRDATTLMRCSRQQWWLKVMIPGIFPYYVTGALTATGGAWNASIVAEVASWGSTRFEAFGLGSYIAKATEAGDTPRVILGISAMSVFVVLVNRLLWRRLFVFAERRLRFD